MEGFRIAYPSFATQPHESVAPLRNDAEDYFLPIRGDLLLVRATSGGVTLCRGWPKGLEHPKTPSHFVGWLRDRPCHGVMIESKTGALAQQGPPGYVFKDIRGLHGLLQDADLQAGMTALEVLHWQQTYVLCPTCGHRLVAQPGSWHKRCGSCGLDLEPRKQPTVMGLLHAGPQVLLAQPHGLGEIFSLPAVTVGPGQSLELALQRWLSRTLGMELREVDLAYHGSQSWPFPDRLMVGMHAPVTAGKVVFDPGIYGAARWFHVDDLPGMPAPLSLARRMVDWYAQLPRVSGKPTIPRR